MRDLFNAGLFFVSDLLSSLVFAGVFALTQSIFAATATGLGLGLAQIAWMKARRRPIDAMQWMSLGLVVVFGGATLFTHNGLFIKVKPAIIYAVVGAFMLTPGWMNRYMPPIVMETAPEVPRTFGLLWAGLMFATALATAVVALKFDNRTYAAFLASFPLASKLALFGLQYLVTRILVRRRIQAGLAVADQTVRLS